MTNLAKPWKPSHPDVVHRLLDNSDKLGIHYVDYITEVRMHIGQDVERQIDLVTIGSLRTRGEKQGNFLILYEIKTDPSRLFRIVLGAIEQLRMYSLALNNPPLYVVGEDRIEKLSHSFGYRQWLVIQKALWEEREGLSEDELEKLGEILALWNVGIITYDAKWKFKVDEEFGIPQEEPTEYLTKTVRKKRAEKK